MTACVCRHSQEIVFKNPEYDIMGNSVEMFNKIDKGIFVIFVFYFSIIRAFIGKLRLFELYCCKFPI